MHTFVSSFFSSNNNNNNINNNNNNDNDNSNNNLVSNGETRDDDLLTSVVSSSQELTDFSFLTPLEQIDSAFQNIFAVQTSQQNNQRFQLTFYTCFKQIYFTFISHLFHTQFVLFATIKVLNSKFGNVQT